jgi:hypothetical protein
MKPEGVRHDFRSMAHSWRSMAQILTVRHATPKGVIPWRITL